MISVLRSFDAFNAFYHFIHQQCCLLVTKDCHNPIFASQVFSRWHLSHCLLLAFSWILIMKTPWFVMLLTTFPSTVLSVGQQRWSQASSSHRNFFKNLFLQSVSSCIVSFALGSSEVCNAFYDFSMYSVVGWSSVMVTILSSHHRFFLADIFLTVRF